MDMLICRGQPLCNGNANSENICHIIVNIPAIIKLLFSTVAGNAGKLLLLLPRLFSADMRWGLTNLMLPTTRRQLQSGGCRQTTNAVNLLCVMFAAFGQYHIWSTV